MREKEIEKRLVAEVKRNGGICPGYSGMPDRIILLPKGKIAFAELKAPGQKPRPLQVARHKILMGLGFRVYVIDGTEQIGGVIHEIKNSV